MDSKSIEDNVISALKLDKDHNHPLQTSVELTQRKRNTTINNYQRNYSILIQATPWTKKITYQITNLRSPLALSLNNDDQTQSQWTTRHKSFESMKVTMNNNSDFLCSSLSPPTLIALTLGGDHQRDGILRVQQAAMPHNEIDSSKPLCGEGAQSDALLQLLTSKHSHNYTPTTTAFFELIYTHISIH